MKDKKGVWRRKEREADVGSIKIRNTDKQFILSTSFNSCVNWHLNRAKFINSYSGTYINYIYIYIYRRRQWHPTPVLLPGKSHGRRSLVDCSPWGRWGSDMTEQLTLLDSYYQENYSGAIEIIVFCLFVVV